jgi:hypothetical protein
MDTFSHAHTRTHRSRIAQPSSADSNTGSTNGSSADANPDAGAEAGTGGKTNKVTNKIARLSTQQRDVKEGLDSGGGSIMSRLGGKKTAAADGQRGKAITLSEHATAVTKHEDIREQPVAMSEVMKATTGTKSPPPKLENANAGDGVRESERNKTKNKEPTT